MFLLRRLPEISKVALVAIDTFFGWGGGGDLSAPHVCGRILMLPRRITLQLRNLRSQYSNVCDFAMKSEKEYQRPGATCGDGPLAAGCFQSVKMEISLGFC